MRPCLITATVAAATAAGVGAGATAAATHGAGAGVVVAGAVDATTTTDNHRNHRDDSPGQPPMQQHQRPRHLRRDNVGNYYNTNDDYYNINDLLFKKSHKSKSNKRPPSLSSKANKGGSKGGKSSSSKHHASYSSLDGSDGLYDILSTVFMSMPDDDDYSGEYSDDIYYSTNAGNNNGNTDTTGSTTTGPSFFPRPPTNQPTPLVTPSFFTPLTLPQGRASLRPCNSIIEMNYPDNILPKQVILAVLHGTIDKLMGGSSNASQEEMEAAKRQIEQLVKYDVRARKVCTSCEEANFLWGSSSGSAADTDTASNVMPYCKEGGFAYGRTIGGLVLEPMDSMTGEVVVGKVASTFWTDVTDENPFLAASQIWPFDLSIAQPAKYSLGAMASASAGTFSFVPDVLGNGEDWENERSYMVKQVYQASAIPLLLKVQDDIQQDYNCTSLDKRIAIMGYSEGGYAAISVADAIDRLNDGYIHTFTGVGAAPIKLSSEQTFVFVQMNQNAYAFPPFVGRLANAYSSTNQDLANTDVAGQNMASDEYLHPQDESMNVVAWSKYALNYTEIFAFMPKPPDASFTDIVNPEFLDVILNSWAANNSDPCNSDFRTNSVNEMCATLKDNDLLETLESFEYPVIFCHSPNDEIVYHSNLPDVSMYDNFFMVQDLLPGVLDPQGSHGDTYAACLMGFLFPFIAPAEDGDIRQIMPMEDATCAISGNGEQEDDSLVVSGVPLVSHEWSVEDGENVNIGNGVDGVGSNSAGSGSATTGDEAHGGNSNHVIDTTFTGNSQQLQQQQQPDGSGDNAVESGGNTIGGNNANSNMSDGTADLATGETGNDSGGNVNNSNANASNNIVNNTTSNNNNTTSDSTSSSESATSGSISSNDSIHINDGDDGVLQGELVNNINPNNYVNSNNSSNTTNATTSSGKSDSVGTSNDDGVVDGKNNSQEQQTTSSTGGNDSNPASSGSIGNSTNNSEEQQTTVNTDGNSNNPASASSDSSSNNTDSNGLMNASTNNATTTTQATAITMSTTYTPQERESIIQTKCQGHTTLSRSLSILEVLGDFVTNPELIIDQRSDSAQYLAFLWLVYLDDAILCPPLSGTSSTATNDNEQETSQRIIQRYTMALMYYQFRGHEWSNCQSIQYNFNDSSMKIPSTCVVSVSLGTGDTVVGEVIEQLKDEAQDDVTATATIIPAVRFLHSSHECTWFGASCDQTLATTTIASNNNSGTTRTSATLFSPITEISLPNNNLKGDIPLEIYDAFTELRMLALDGNEIGGSISEGIGKLNALKVLQLNNNNLTGSIPFDSISRLGDLEILQLSDNQMYGNATAICRELSSTSPNPFQILETDCASSSPVVCPCCTECM